MKMSKMIQFVEGAEVSLFGERCIITKVHAGKDLFYDLESLDLKDEEGNPCTYSNVSQLALD